MIGKRTIYGQLAMLMWKQNMLAAGDAVVASKEVKGDRATVVLRDEQGIAAAAAPPEGILASHKQVVLRRIAVAKPRLGQ